MIQKLTYLQFGFLTFSFLYGGTLLSPGAYNAGRGAWIAALIGSAAGLLWLFALGRFSEAETKIGSRNGLGSIAYRIACLGTLFLLLSLSLADFGVFWNREVMPSLSPVLCSMALFTVSLYAVFHGTAAIGRFAELSIFALIPLLLILFPGLLSGQISRLYLSSSEEMLLPIAKSSLGVLVSTFGDSLALSILASDVISVRSDSATVFARASASASKDTFPLINRLRPKRHPLTAALLFGGAGAALLFILTVVGNQARLGSDVLSAVAYPVSFASKLLHHEVLDPFFIFCLTLLYTVKAMVLLLACCKLLAGLLPQAIAFAAPVAITQLSFFFFLLLAFLPRLTDEAEKSPFLLLLLILFEFLVPVFHGFSIFIKKDLTNREKHSTIDRNIDAEQPQRKEEQSWNSHNSKD